MLRFLKCFDDKATTLNDLNRYIKSRSKSQLVDLLYPQDKKVIDYLGFCGEFKKLMEKHSGNAVVSEILTP